PFCQVYTYKKQGWVIAAHIRFNDRDTLDNNTLDAAKIKDIILGGQLKAVPKEWSDIQIQDTTVDVSYYDLR
ncbi:MAG: DUF4153 domain-containing protein, partial [Hafnia sp.]